MGMRMRRRTRQLAFVTVAMPVAAWAALEQAARRAEVRDPASLASRRLRQGADLVQRFGRGPLADRLQRRAASTTVTRTDPGRVGTGLHGG
jgi:hypothetical protein